MANILLITDYYPPRQSIATNRMKAFVKYLTEMDHKVFVITLGEKTTCKDENAYYCTDDDFIKPLNTQAKDTAIIHYAKCAVNIIQMFFHMYSKTWVKNVVDTADKIFIEQKIDILITSYPTIGNLIAGNMIKGKYSNVKWIMDMRDAVWTPNYNKIIRKKMIGVAKRCLRKCDAVTVVSKVHAEIYADYSDRKISCEIVRNGYDFTVPILNNNRHEKFNIVYAGNFYGARSPRNFLIAFENVIRKYDIEDICFTIVGNHSIVRLNDDIKRFVREIPRMGYDEVINYCAENAETLLMVIPKSNERGVYTGKLFDYIGIGKPILGLIPIDDVAADLLRQAGNGYIAENEDVAAIESVIYQAYVDWRNGEMPKINRSIQEQCHRRLEIRKLSKFIERLGDE